MRWPLRLPITSFESLPSAALFRRCLLSSCVPNLSQDNEEWTASFDSIHFVARLAITNDLNCPAKAAFDAFDRDGNGALDREEFGGAMR